MLWANGFLNEPIIEMGLELASPWNKDNCPFSGPFQAPPLKQWPLFSASACYCQADTLKLLIGIMKNDCWTSKFMNATTAYWNWHTSVSCDLAVPLKNILIQMWRKAGCLLSSAVMFLKYFPITSFTNYISFSRTVFCSYSWPLTFFICRVQTWEWSRRVN